MFAHICLVMKENTIYVNLIALLSESVLGLNLITSTTYTELYIYKFHIHIVHYSICLDLNTLANVDTDR